MGKAVQDLKKEHESILHVFRIMENMSERNMEESARLGYDSDLVDFFKVFADKCHHGKEELYLFEELVNAGVHNEGGIIGTLLQEHNLGRDYLAIMDTAVQKKNAEEFDSAAEKYLLLMRNHIDRENKVLFEMADQLLDEAKQDEIFEKFEQHEQSVIGHGIHEKLHAMIHGWSEEFDVE
ncbi:hemerythrin domain-containing protein [Parasporobacterium paucivorans]|uniref:Hemerythrin-like domain-containing protein n=1 Tax=Parasporobacterium paucivorans DSM 15970 TaxID=1122934 RepID=A0A1M6JI01_9FIRM|nr:hemerythrin domain-containing protein [Parasporobacterium paucivorans]SHJ46265.1 Hemerythrin-like domain-containing protein [Parasporobacterium paucivorans DSM 15970]